MENNRYVIANEIIHPTVDRRNHDIAMYWKSRKEGRTDAVGAYQVLRDSLEIAVGPYRDLTNTAIVEFSLFVVCADRRRRRKQIVAQPRAKLFPH